MLVDKLEKIYHHFLQLSEQITDPDFIKDMKRYVKLNKEYKDLQPLVESYKEYKNILSNVDAAKDIVANEKDQEFRDMAKLELEQYQQRRDQLEEEIKELLIPEDPEDSKNAILELRAGTGGDEASIFVGDLFRMYSKYIEKKGWQMEMVSQSLGTSGGFKEIIVNITGEKVYGVMKYESGVHRVQRVPETETQGRVHTSAASIAVLPEADEVDVEVHERDIKKDTFRAQGAGGQHVNKTESAVRLTHIPSGMIVECQNERSQIKNYASALKVLRTRLYELEVAKQQAEIAKKRKTMVSTGDRSAKIRTYNYPQGRVTDHRIGLTLYNLPAVMNGEVEEIIDALRVAENAEKLKAGETL